MKVLKGLTRVVIGVTALALAGCAGGPPPPTVVELTMVAAQDVNSYAGAGTGFPVELSIYELKSPEALIGKVYGEIGELSGNLTEEPYSLTPGESQTARHELDPDSRYLGVVAHFGQINTGVTTWKATMPIAPNETSAVTANVGASTVTLQ